MGTFPLESDLQYINLNITNVTQTVVNSNLLHGLETFKSLIIHPCEVWDIRVTLSFVQACSELFQAISLQTTVPLRGLLHTGQAMRKGPYCPESLSYQKKDGRAWPRQPFFWYNTDVPKKKKKKNPKNVFQKKKKNLKIRCHIKPK